MGLHYLVRIIHECRREAFEIEGRVAYLQSVEVAEREKPRETRGSEDVASIHE